MNPYSLAGIFGACICGAALMVAIHDREPRDVVTLLVVGVAANAIVALLMLAR